ncbi:hypothetical protein Dimus_014317 [Dionaea muscipula]
MLFYCFHSSVVCFSLFSCCVGDGCSTSTYRYSLWCSLQTPPSLPCSLSNFSSRSVLCSFHVLVEIFSNVTVLWGKEQEGQMKDVPVHYPISVQEVFCVAFMCWSCFVILKCFWPCRLFKSKDKRIVFLSVTAEYIHGRTSPLMDVAVSCQMVKQTRKCKSFVGPA